MSKKTEEAEVKYRSSTQEEVDEFNKAFGKLQEELKVRTVITVHFDDEGKLQKQLIVLKQEEDK